MPGGGDLTVRAAAASRQGPLHERNEDAWLICEGPEDRGSFYVVCDGVSAGGRGELASRLSCERLAQYLDGEQAITVEGLAQLISEIDWELRGAGTGAACTLSLLWLRAHTAWWFQVGDSPIVRVRAGEVERLGPRRDGGGAGTVSPLRSYLGMGPKVSEVLELASAPLGPGDLYMLVTDGVSGVLDDEALARYWERCRDPERTAREVIEAVARGGTQDDATVVVVYHMGAEHRPSSASPTEAPDPPERLVGRPPAFDGGREG